MFAMQFSQVDKEYRNQQTAKNIKIELCVRTAHAKNFGELSTQTIKRIGIVEEALKQLEVDPLLDINTLMEQALNASPGIGQKGWLAFVFEGYPAPTPAKHKGATAVMYEEAKKASRKGRKAEYVYKLLDEVKAANQRGAYLLFNTLTIAPEREQSFRDGTEIKKYVRNITQQAKKAAPENEQPHRYFGCVEYGEKTGRLHFHFLHIFEEIWFGDPNVGSPIPSNRIVKTLYKMWPNGFSMPIPVRTKGDAYEKTGWKWPYDKKGQPLQAKPVDAVAFYMAKYVTKEQETCQRKSLSKMKFRTKTSRNFGIQKLKTIAEILTQKERLVALLEYEMITLGLRNRPPKNLMNKTVLKKWMANASTQEKSQLRQVIDSQPSLQQRSQISTRKKQMHSLRKITSTLTMNITDMDISNVQQKIKGVMDDKVQQTAKHAAGHYHR